MSRSRGPSTRSVHLGDRVDAATRAVVPPVVQSSAFAFDSLEDWEEVARHRKHGDIYSRNSNPTTRRLAERVAALEGAEAGTTFGSGMAAIATTLLALLGPGRRAVTIRDAYGGTYLLFTRLLPRWGADCAVLDTDDADGLGEAIDAGCDLVYLETPTNPSLEVLDLAPLIERAHGVGAVVVVDNTFATPVNQRPLEMGADLVVHSATKYLGGHGDAMGGVLCGDAELVGRVFRLREIAGPCLDPHAASLLLRGLKTLGLRVQRQNDNALAIARFLETRDEVRGVFYPGLDSHPGHEVARRQMDGFGGVLSFDLAGGMEAARLLLPRLELARLAPNLGQVETVVGPAALTSHVELSPEEIAASGVPPGRVRYAAGIEDADDLRADLAAALDSL